MPTPGVIPTPTVEVMSVVLEMLDKELVRSVLNRSLGSGSALFFKDTVGTTALGNAHYEARSGWTVQAHFPLPVRIWNLTGRFSRARLSCSTCASVSWGG